MPVGAPVDVRGKPAALRLKAPVVAENPLHASTVDLLRKLVMPPAEWAAYPAGHIKLTGQQGAELERMGLREGWPDFLVSYDGMNGIELKRVGGRLSISGFRRKKDRSGNIRMFWVDGQREVFPRLVASRGFKQIVVCETLDEVEAALLTFGVPLRGHS